MIVDIYCALTVSFVTVLLCTMSVTSRLRTFTRKITDVLECTYCTTFWLSLAIVPTQSWTNLLIRILAVAAASNILVLLIHLSLYMETEDDENNQ